jgi:hypothetical protein
MWIAMFTLTDDVLSQEILNAWERKVDVKDRAVWDIGIFQHHKCVWKRFNVWIRLGKK